MGSVVTGFGETAVRVRGEGRGARGAAGGATHPHSTAEPSSRYAPSLFRIDKRPWTIFLIFFFHLPEGSTRSMRS